MSNTPLPTTTENPIFALYCGETVIVTDTESTEYGTVCYIQYEDGKEDSVPMVRLDFLS